MNRLKHIAGGASLALILTITASTGFVLLATVLEQIADDLLEASGPPRSGINEQLVVSDEGTPLIRRSHRQPIPKVEILDIEHQPVSTSPGTSRWQLADLAAKPPHYPRWLRQFGPWYRVRRVEPKNPIGENWYIVFNGNRSQRFYLQGIKTDDGETIGYISRAGFQEAKPEEESLFLNGPRRLESMLDRTLTTGENSLVFVLDNRQLLSVDIATQTVEPLIEAPILSMDGLDGQISGFNTTDPGEIIAVRTPEHVHILDWNGEIQRAFVIPEELRDRPFQFFTPDEGAMYFSRTEEELASDEDGDGAKRFELVRATASGEVTERTPVSLARASHRSETGLGLTNTFRITAAAVPATLWSAGFAFGFLPKIVAATEDDLNFPQALKQWAGQLVWVVLLVIAFCGWLAWLAFEHQRRLGEPHGWFWAVFVFLFGLPGYLGYRLHRSWPYSEPIPAPVPTGLEVFAY